MWNAPFKTSHRIWGWVTHPSCKKTLLLWEGFRNGFHNGFHNGFPNGLLMVSASYQTVSSKARSWLQCLIGFPIYGLHQGNKAKLMLSSATYWLQHQRLIFTSRWIHDKVLAVPSGGTLSKGLVIITTTTMPSHHDRSSHPLDTFLQKSLSFGHGPSVG